MNEGVRKVQKVVRRTDLGDDEVDGHFATEEKIESFGVGEEGASSEILGLFGTAPLPEKVRLEL